MTPITLPIILKGITGLLSSKKGVMCMLILAISGIALFCAKLDGTSFAAVVGTVAVIYNFTQHRVDIASLGISNKE